MALPFLASREQIAGAFDVRPSADLDTVLDRLARQATDHITDSLHRTFWPTTATKTWRLDPRDWHGRHIWLPDDLLTLTSLSIDSTSVTGSVLEPQFHGPPYTRIDLEDATASGGEDFSLTGVWGYSADTALAGTVATALSDTTGTTLIVSDAGKVGVGDLLTIDSERLVVTARTWSTTGTTLGGNLTAQTGETTVPVASGAAVKVGEFILIDSETMRVTAVVSNNLTVRRAQQGSTLATHSSGATVSASRTLTVERGATGSTAATHTQGTTIYRNVPPGQIPELCVALVQTTLGQEGGSWNLTIGDGENEREAPGRALDKLWKKAHAMYGRRRYGAV